MGNCRSTSDKRKREKNKDQKLIYSINRFDSDLVPIAEVDKPLKFEVRLHNFRAKGLKEEKFYFGKIVLGSEKSHIFELPLTKGPDPKFLIDKLVYFEIDFYKMKSTYMDIYFYSVKQSHIKENLNKKAPCCILSIDFLSLLIGPEHHDIHLVHTKKNTVFGRISFDFQSQQVEYLSININKLKCKLHHRFNNEISFKLKYLNNHSFLESDYTCPIKGEIDKKEDFTLYNWSGEDGDQDIMSFEKLLLSTNDLRSCNFEIRLFETNYEITNESKDKPKSQFQLSKRYAESSRNLLLKQQSTIRIMSSETDEDRENLNENQIYNRDSSDRYSKVIKHDTVFEKFDNHNAKILEKHEVDEKKSIKVKPHYNEIGFSRINFYNVLLRQDDMMFKQSSRVFHKFSYLYRSPTDEKKSGEASHTYEYGLSSREKNIKSRRNSFVPNECGMIKEKSIQENMQHRCHTEVEMNEYDELAYDLMHNTQPDNKLHFILFNDISNCLFKQEILYNGKVIGEIEGLISILNIPMISQMVCGVHTERGLDISANFLFGGNISNAAQVSSNSGAKTGSNNSAGNNLTSPTDTLPNQIREISKFTSNLIGKIINHSSITQFSFSSREINVQIAGILKELLTRLNSTHNQKDANILIFDYKSEHDLIKSQQIMLELALNVIHMIDSFNIEIRILCFRIIESILEREEFSLSSMSLIVNYDKQKYPGKIKVIEDYIDYTLKILDYTLGKLSSKVSDEKTKNFIESILAVSYLRVPKFQEAFLESVQKNVDFSALKSDIKISPYFSTHFSSYGFNSLNLANNTTGSQTTDAVNSNINISLLDWQILFYDKIDKIKEINLADKFAELDEILYKKSTWQERISKRGLGFYYVVSHIEKYVNKKLGLNSSLTKTINWSEIPGFKIIIDSIVYELQTKEVYTYPEPLINILKIFINDFGIMNRFYKTIILKTNAYDTPSVYNAIKILNFFFEEYEKKKEISDFGYKFDYSLLKKASDAIFQVDHSVCVAKLIWLYYKNIHLMNIVHFYETFSETFKPRFFSLFFHWSWQVRNIFYHLLWFIINHRLKNKNFSTEQSRLCQERLEYLSNKEDAKFSNIAFNTDYPEELKKVILGDYYEKMRNIEIIRSIVKKEKLDPTYKTEFKTTDTKINPIITEDIKDFIVVGIYHYDSVEKFYRGWERDNRINKQPKYPDISLQPPKDDIAEYSSENADAW